MDPETQPEGGYSQAEMLHAYGLASKAGDKEAMDELHGMIVKAQTHYNPTDDMSTGEKLLAGTGHGMQRMLQGAGNLVGLKNETLGTTDQDLKNKDETAKPLLDTTAGKIGDIAGQAALTAPVGLGSGALAAKVAGKGGAQLLKMALAAGENGAQSATMADPDQQGEQAMKGAALGAGLSTLGKVGGAAVRGTIPPEVAEKAARFISHRVLPFSAGGAAMEMAHGSPLAAAATIGVPYALSTKTAQKALSGNLAGQKALADFIRNNPQAAYSLGSMARSDVDAAGQ